jgi:hypothetical protein
MSWQRRDDLGLEVVGKIHDTLKISDQWRQDIDRGFKWWPGSFCQKVWAENSNFSNAQSFFRVHCETELFKGRGHNSEFELNLATEMAHASTSALVHYTECETYTLHTSAYFTRENEEWLTKLFVGGSLLQLLEVFMMGREFAQKIKAVGAITGHPMHGLRDQPDPIIGAAHGWFRPTADESRWTGIGEWKQTEWAMDRQANHFESDHHTHLKAQFPWFLDQASSIDLFVTTDEPHPHYGNGLHQRMVIPLKLAPDRCAHTALMLNGMEAKDWLRCHTLGSWSFEDGQLEYESFIPNTLYSEGILENITLSMAIRAQWVNDQFAAWFNAT